MSVDILYYSDNNFSFQTLNELMYRLQTTLNEKIYLMYYDNFEKKHIGVLIETLLPKFLI